MPLAVCATPIGNLEDVTLRVLAELAAADVVLCEDTRHTRGLLERHGIKARLLSYHEHNEAQRTAELLPRLEAGESGRARLRRRPARRVRSRRAARARGARRGRRRDGAARAVGGRDGARRLGPGGGAVPLPRLPSARARRSSRQLWDELRGWPWPAVAFESPQRLPATLRSLAAADPEREVAVCRELTKRFEEVVRGTAAELAERFGAPPKGEITLVLGPGAARCRGRRGALRSPPSPSSWRPACRGGRRRRSSRASRASRGTGSTSSRCKQI